MLGTIVSWITGGALGRVFDTIDRKIESETDQQRLKADILQEHIRNRPPLHETVLIWSTLLASFAASGHFAWVAIYSSALCTTCANPVGWDIAALPPVMQEWQGALILSPIGALAVTRLPRLLSRGR